MILLTGGTGYIGSHVAVELIKKAYPIMIIDNLCNSELAVLDKIKAITGVKPQFVKADLRDFQSLDEIFKNHQISSVIHFAGLKAVGESVQNPLNYYDHNVLGTITLLKAMSKHNDQTIVFSSSATVYAPTKELPLTEQSALAPYNPYGFSKFMIEQILNDLAQADHQIKVANLRYFNPIGADKSGLIGENLTDLPNNLMPYILKVARKELPYLSIFGNDYPTQDGTGIRDYIHVTDLALAHISALEFLKNHQGSWTFNIGTGKGSSVLEIIKSFEAATGIKIPYQITPRRPGDIAETYADPSFAKEKLGWQAQKNLQDMCLDAWHFAQNML